MIKITFFVLLFTGTLVISCNHQASNKNSNKEADKETSEKVSTSKTIELTKSDFIVKVFDYESGDSELKYLGDKPALIDFYASWCGPCKMIAPVLEELAEEYEGEIYIYKINTDIEKELASAFGIRSIPALLFVPMDGPPQMATGALPKESFIEAIDNVLLNR